MPDKYYQEYGPIRRRQEAGTLHDDEAWPAAPRLTQAEPAIEGDLGPARPARRRSREDRRRRGRGLGLLMLLLLVVAGVGGFLALPYALGLVADDQAMQGVTLQGQPIAGMSRAEVRAMLEQRYGAFMHAPLTLTFEDRSWTPTLAQLGVGFDLDQLTGEALAAGHRGGPIARARELWALWQGGLELAPRLSVDGGTLQAYLASVGAEIERPPRDAALSIADGKVIPTAGQPGRQPLADATAVDVLSALQTLTPKSVTLRTRALRPTLADEGIAQAVRDARELLSGPLVMRHDAESWIWDPAKIAELLAIQADAGRMTVDVDPKRLGHAVQKLAQIVDSGSVEPRVAFRKGKLAITKPGQTGWKLRQAEAATAISATLRLPKREMALPLEAATPQVTAKTLPSLGITELVGEGRSSFAGSAAYRITNIKAGAARLNGVLIPPGAEFSFNTQIGAIDENNGFVQGYAVIGNRTQLEWGGGVCQDSTTVFRAAFWAGLPITERHAHPFYISWYDDYSFPDEAGPGMDATIYTGVLDLKFVNDTGHWLLMESTADEKAQVLSVRLYGTKTNRTVVAKGPDIERIIPAPDDPEIVYDPALPAGTVKQTDHARRGMDITVYRVITEAGAQKIPEPFYTRFKAWPDVYVKGTG
jgi:vancomycin resistance protein YoaR